MKRHLLFRLVNFGKPARAMKAGYRIETARIAEVGVEVVIRARAMKAGHRIETTAPCLFHPPGLLAHAMKAGHRIETKLDP